MMVAKRIGDRLRSLQIPHAASEVSEYVSVSCGVASTTNSLISSSDFLVAHADGALYAAKQQGRDRCVLAVNNKY